MGELIELTPNSRTSSKRGKHTKGIVTHLSRGSSAHLTTSLKALTTSLRHYLTRSELHSGAGCSIAIGIV